MRNANANADTFSADRKSWKLCVSMAPAHLSTHRTKSGREILTHANRHLHLPCTMTLVYVSSNESFIFNRIGRAIFKHMKIPSNP